MVGVEGRLVGYEVEEFTKKDGTPGSRHTVTLSCETGDLEAVELLDDLRAACKALRDPENFGVTVRFMCRHSLGYRNFDRASVLTATALL